MTASALEVRLAAASDLAALDLLYRRSYSRLLRADYPASTLVLAIPRFGRAQPRLVASGRFYVATDAAGRLLGAGGWSAAREPGGGWRAEVRHVATDPDEVRRGVGRAILGRVLDAARDEGMATVRAIATLSAVPFYQAQGFARRRRVDLPLGAGMAFPAVEMRRRV